MINRRIIRIKVLQTLFAYLKSENGTIEQAEKDMNFSFSRFYDLYFYVFLLLIDIVDYAALKQEKAKKKITATEEELNPNQKFVKNKIVAQLRENTHLKNYLQATKLSWVKNPEIIKELHDKLTETERFKQYMQTETRAYKDDKSLIIFLVNEIIYNNENFFLLLEEKSIFWSDNTEYVLEMVEKTLRKFSIGTDMTYRLMPKFKNEIDQNFGKTLLRKTALNLDNYKSLIEENVVNWDYERIAFIDILIIQIAINEVINFPEIPVKVTFNEYIELSKMYSTKRSGNFVNGILDKVVHKLKAEGKINKIGRGLL